MYSALNSDHTSSSLVCRVGAYVKVDCQTTRSLGSPNLMFNNPMGNFRLLAHAQLTQSTRSTVQTNKLSDLGRCVQGDKGPSGMEA